MASTSSATSFNRWIIPALILTNAIGVICFRHVVSLDGPMHLLHAALVKDAWTGGMRTAEGMWTAARAWELNMGDLFLVPLSGIIPVFVLHKLIMAMAVLVLCVGSWSIARAYGRPLNAAWLLVLPFSFCFLLVLGMFSFLIATGIAFACTAWWMKREHVRPSTLIGLAGAFALCTFAHKSGGCLLLLFVGTHEVFLFGTERSAWKARWAAVSKKLLATFLVLLAIAISWVVYRVIVVETAWSPEAHRPLRELFTLRALLLVDSKAELPLRIGLGVLFAALFTIALRERWRNDEREHPSDALLLSSALLLIASVIARTPKAEVLYIIDRAQWLALLLAACWISVQAIPRRVSLVAALAILLLHSARMVYIERRMHGMEARDRLTLDAAAHLDSHRFTVPVLLDNDWLAGHITGYVADASDGIVFTGRDHVRFEWKRQPTIHVYSYIFSLENNWEWIAPHCAKGTPPELHHVLVLGHPVDPQGAAVDSLDVALTKYYTSTYRNAYAEVWTLK